MAKGTRSRKIPAMVTITITGENKAMYKALCKAVQKVNRIRIAHGDEAVPYVINHISTSRP